jgi:hypothetical protein
VGRQRLSTQTGAEATATHSKQTIRPVCIFRVVEGTLAWHGKDASKSRGNIQDSRSAQIKTTRQVIRKQSVCKAELKSKQEARTTFEPVVGEAATLKDQVTEECVHTTS